MKRIGLIVLMIIAAAVATLVIAVATLPMPKVAIVAIAPTGKIITRTNEDGTVFSGPEWLFGITNVSRATAYWVAGVLVRPLDAPDTSASSLGGGLQEGTLRAGEQVVTSMIVTNGDKTAWCGLLKYCIAKRSLQGHLLGFAARTPGLVRLLPKWDDTFGESWTIWHPATNAPLASPVTNTP